MRYLTVYVLSKRNISISRYKVLYTLERLSEKNFNSMNQIICILKPSSLFKISVPLAYVIVLGKQKMIQFPLSISLAGKLLF